MKIFIRYFFSTLVVLACAVLAQSCSDQNSDIKKKLSIVASSRDDVVMVGDLEHTLEQLDIKVANGRIMIPDQMRALAQEDSESTTALDNMERGEIFKAVDMTSAVVLGKMSGSTSYTLVYFNVTGSQQLKDALTTLDMSDVRVEREGDYDIVTDGNFALVVDGNDCFMVVRDGQPQTGSAAVSELSTWFDEAKNYPLEGWKKDYLAQTCVMSMWLSSNMVRMFEPKGWDEINAKLSQFPDLKLENLSIGLRGNLEGESLKVNASLFNGDKVMSNPFAGKFDTEMLRYTGPSDNVVMALALSSPGLQLLKAETDKYMDRVKDEMNDIPMNFNPDEDLYTTLMSSLTALSGLLDAMDGSVLYTCGLNTDAGLIGMASQPSKMVRMLLAVKLKDNKGPVFMQEFIKYMDQYGYEACSEGTGFKMVLEGSGDYFYATLDADCFVLYINRELAGGESIFDKNLFNKSWLTLQAVVKQDISLPLPFKLPFGACASLTSDKMSFDMTVSLTGTDKKFVLALVSMVRDFVTFAKQNLVGYGEAEAEVGPDSSREASPEDIQLYEETMEALQTLTADEDYEGDYYD